MTENNAQPASDQYQPSPGQAGLWSLTQLDSIGSAYNRGTALKLTGDVDINALKQSVTTLLERHRALRSRFPAKDGTPMAVVSAIDVPMEVLDLRSSKEPLNQALSEAAAFVHEPYDLERGPLFRCRVYRLAKGEHLLVVGDHEIVSDGAGWNLVLTDLGSLYTSMIDPGEQHQSGNSEPPGYYVWVSQSRQQSQNTEGVGDALAYRRAPLLGASLLNLSTSRPRPLAQRHQGSAVGFEVPAALAAQLEAKGAELGINPFIVYLTLYKLFLSRRLTRKRGLVVGIAEEGRADPATKNLVGSFLDTLPIRIQLHEATSFEQALSSPLQ